MLRRIRKLREKYGPLYRLMERGSRLAKFIKSRPLLQKAFEDFKPDFLSPEEFRGASNRGYKQSQTAGVNIFTFYTCRNHS